MNRGRSCLGLHDTPSSLLHAQPRRRRAVQKHVRVRLAVFVAFKAFNTFVLQHWTGQTSSLSIHTKMCITISPMLGWLFFVLSVRTEISNNQCLKWKKRSAWTPQPKLPSLPFSPSLPYSTAGSRLPNWRATLPSPPLSSPSLPLSLPSPFPLLPLRSRPLK